MARDFRKRDSAGSKLQNCNLAEIQGEALMAISGMSELKFLVPEEIGDVEYSAAVPHRQPHSCDLPHDPRAPLSV